MWVRNTILMLQPTHWGQGSGTPPLKCVPETTCLGCSGLEHCVMLPDMKLCMKERVFMSSVSIYLAVWAVGGRAGGLRLLGVTGPQLLFETLVLSLQHLQLLLQICRPLHKHTHTNDTVMVAFLYTNKTSTISLNHN